MRSGRDDRLRDVWVEGEVGRVTRRRAPATATSRSRTSAASCRACSSATTGWPSPFEPAAGLRVVAHGRIDVFEAQGVYQLYVEHRSSRPGFGDLALRFEALKAQLAAEGLFDAARKRPLPDAAARSSPSSRARRAPSARHPHACSPGAGRWPASCSSPCQVQGDGRAGEHRRGAATASAAGPSDAPRRRPRRRADVDDPRPRRRLARGPVVVQRRGRRAGGRRRIRCPVVVRRRPRDGRDPGRLRGRRARPDAVRGGRARRARPGRASPSRVGRLGAARLEAVVAPRGSAALERELAAERRALDRAQPGGPARGGAGAGRACCSTARRGARRAAALEPAGRAAGAGRPRAPVVVECPARRSRRPGSASGRRRARRRSARRRRSTGATRSSAGRPTAGSCATRPRRRRGPAWRSGWPGASSRRPSTPATADGDRRRGDRRARRRRRRRRWRSGSALVCSSRRGSSGWRTAPTPIDPRRPPSRPA